MKDGQCSDGGGPRKGRSLTLRLGPGCEGATASFGGFVLLTLSSSWDKRPGILARQPYSSVVLVRTVGPAAHGSGGVGFLYAPFLDPRGHQCTCTEKRPVSRGEARSAFNSSGDEASFTSGVPHHTPPDLAVSAPPLSHTHSRREPGEGRR